MSALSSSYGAQQPPIARSSSFLGTIRNIVTAPLSWFSSSDDFESDAGGKRKPIAQSAVHSPTDEETSQRIKRMRIHSPEGDHRGAGRVEHPSAIYSNVSKPSIASRASSNQPKSARHTLSPSRRLAAAANSRTMSLDPPSFRRKNGITRDVSMKSIASLEETPNFASREQSIGPSFRFRSSLTPQPSGSNFGPIVSRSERDGSEPPPLSALMSNPVFVRAPSEHLSSSNLRPKATLGSIADAQRSTSRPPQGPFNFGSHSSYMSNVGFSSLRPMSAAEKALHELDVYKTPLLPSRLRGSAHIPDMFKPRKSRSLILMNDDERISVGTKGKGKEVNEKKPYAGEGGMKKLLARRKKEQSQLEREEAVIQKASKDEDEMRVESPKEQSYDAEAMRDDVPNVYTKPASSVPWSVAESDQQSSSLRVGRSKSSRNHARSVGRPSKSRFSANYGEEDNEDDESRIKERQILEEAAKKAPLFETPPGFSFAKEEVPVLNDSSNAKEPPIQSLPFSFSRAPASNLTQTGHAPFSSGEIPSSSSAAFKPLATSSAVTSSLGAPSSGPADTRVEMPQPAPSNNNEKSADSRSSINDTAGPAFSFSVEPPPSTAPTPAPSTSSVPNFFATSTAFSKPISVAIPQGGFGTPVDTPMSTPPLTVETASDGTKKITNDTAVPRPQGLGGFGGFGGFGASPSSASTLFGTSATEPEKHVAPPASSTSTGTSASATSTVDKLGRADVGTTSAFPSLPPISTSGFSFGPTTSASLENKTQPVSLFGDVKKTEPPKILFPTATSSAPSSSVEPPKSLFGNTASSTQSGSGGLFSSHQTSTTPVSSTEPPKSSSLATGFSFGQSNTGNAAPPTTPSSATPFSFGAAPATPPQPEKPPMFSFPSSTNPAPTPFSFGAPTTSTPAPSEKPFVFGNTAPPRPATPPRQDQEFRMEESPTRDMQLNSAPIQKLEDRPSLGGGFSFGAANTSSSLPSGKPTDSSPFSFGASGSSGFGTSAANKSADTNPHVSFSSFGQQSSGTGFTFGAKPDPPRPSTTGSFTSSPQTATSPFSFGSTTNAPNPFSQSSGSAPNSPASFNQPTPFSFGASTTPTSTGFAFSQPSSPAAGNSGLPSSGGGGAFTFGAPAPAPSAGGPALFTIGAAPAAAPPGGRVTRRLPTRRGASKR